MHFKQKLAFFVFGCVFVIVGQVVTGLVVPSATAQGGLQDAEFNEVTVRKMTVVDDATGTVVAGMFADADGGRVVVYQPDGRTAADMAAYPTGGSVFFSQPNGTQVASMSALEGGGYIMVTDKHGEPEAALGVDANGDGYVIP
jgi:hypothetical protein